MVSAGIPRMRGRGDDGDYSYGRAWALPAVALVLALFSAQLATAEGLGDELDVAESLLQRAQVEPAIRLLRELQTRHPADPAVLALLGRALARHREFSAAEPLLARAADGGHSDLGTLLTLGAVLWENGHLDQAETRYREAVAVSNSAPMALYSLAKLLLWRGDAAGAAPLLAGVRSARPGWSEVSLHYARSLEQVDALDEALREIERFLQGSPEHADALYTQATVLNRLGRRVEAAAAMARYRRAADEDRERARLDGRQAEALKEIVASLGRGDVDGAAALLDRLPETVETLRLRARALELAGRSAEALRMLERAVAADPSRADVRLELEEAYRRSGSAE